MIQRRCPICGQAVLWTSAFLFEQEVLMHARCWPPLAGLLAQDDEPPATPHAGDRLTRDEGPGCKKDTLRHHTYSEGERRWVTPRCLECVWVETMALIEKRLTPRE
jgi:hypothetical protein